jgi:hypothetical protein
MVTQTDEKRWVYTDPAYPGHEVHISAHPAFNGTPPKWYCVYLGSGRVLGHQDGDFLDALAVAANWIHNKGAES